MLASRYKHSSKSAKVNNYVVENIHVYTVNMICVSDPFAVKIAWSLLTLLHLFTPVLKY